MIDLHQYYPDELAEDGLVHPYDFHIDVINNETGFALYFDVPTHWEGRDWELLEDAKKWPAPVYHENYYPGMEAVHPPHDNFLNDYMYLRIREVGEDGQPGDWHTVPLTLDLFTENVNPPDALDDAGFGRFDAVTWLEGLEADKQYQVQLWLDSNTNGRFDATGKYVRGTIITTTTHADGTSTTEETLDDYYYWQADEFSGIHTINTDPDAFNLDIDADGTMDFFVEDNDHWDRLLVGGPGDDRLIGGSGDDQLEGGAGDDYLGGDYGDDRLYGGAGDDNLDGGSGDDRLIGGSGDDWLGGYGGDDYLEGGPGDDHFEGNDGDDRLIGGSGDDVFIISRRDDNDTIEDFGNGSDMIDLTDFAGISDVDDLTITQSDSNTLIDLSAHSGGTITLQDFTGALEDSDFIFAA